MYKYGSGNGGYRQPPATPAPPAPPSGQQAAPGYQPQGSYQMPNQGSVQSNSQPQHSAVPPQQYQQTEPPADQTGEVYISNKIVKINAKDKVIDFSSKLSVAKVEDYANIHGCGGKDHAPNSTVAVTICDYSKGKGDQSVTVSCNVDTEVMSILYHAAMDARLGKLTAPTETIIQTAGVLLNDLNRWEAAGNQNPVAAVPSAELIATGTALGEAVTRNTPNDLAVAGNSTLSDLRRWQSGVKRVPVSAVPLQEIANAKNALAGALNISGVPFFSYCTEKNNPYVKNNQGYVPVSKVYICYTPIRKDGAASRYPWLVQVENFEAPLTTKQNGSSAHDSSKAVNRKVASINLSADDFASAMVAVKRFTRIWEMAYALPVVKVALKKLAEIKDRKKRNAA